MMNFKKFETYISVAPMRGGVTEKKRGITNDKFYALY